MFSGPGRQVNGLEAVPEGLWLCDQQDNHSYLVSYDGTVLTSFPSPARNASGISVGGGSIWVASNVQPSMIFRHDPVTGQCTAYLMLEGAGGVHGLQWRPGSSDAGTLWVTRPGAQRLDHIDCASGALLASIAFPAPRSHGLFWDDDDGTLNVAETNHGHIYRLDPTSGTVLDEWRIEGPEVHGLTRDSQGRIWIGDAATNQILVVDS